MTKHKLTGLALCTGLAMIGTPAVAPTAEAATRPYCAQPKGCLYYNQAWEGETIEIYGDDASLGRDSDEAHSAWNRSSQYLVLWDDDNFRDSCLAIFPRSVVRDLGTSSIHFGDKASSIQFYIDPPDDCPQVGTRTT